METVLLVILVFVGGCLVYLRKRTSTKSTYVKKSEIIQSYKDELSKILNKSTNLPNDKISFLKSTSNELDRNIFFEKNEVKDIIKELARM